MKKEVASGVKRRREVVLRQLPEQLCPPKVKERRIRWNLGKISPKDGCNKNSDSSHYK